MKKATKKKNSGKIGSSFDKFLKQEGVYEDITARAIKRVLARQPSRMHISCAQLDRLLDPDNDSFLQYCF